MMCSICFSLSEAGLRLLTELAFEDAHLSQDVLAS